MLLLAIPIRGRFDGADVLEIQLPMRHGSRTFQRLVHTARLAHDASILVQNPPDGTRRTRDLVFQTQRGVLL
jgi:hypothetical protein